MKQDILMQILGESPASFYIAAMFFSAVGVVISLLISSSKRDQTNPATPDKFSWRYLIWDNSRRIILSVLLILVSLRFFPDFFGQELTMKGALFIGLLYDQLGAWLKNRVDILNIKPKQ